MIGFHLLFAVLQTTLFLGGSDSSSIPEVPTVRFAAPKETVVLPSSVDNSVSPAFPPVFSQIGGSCAQASTIGYMFTYEVNTLLNRNADIPENRFSYLYSWNFINGGEDDGSLSWDGIKLSLNCGMMSEADFPKQTSAYTFNWASGYEKYFRALHYGVKSFQYITADSPEGVAELKRYLYDGGVSGGKGKLVVFSSAGEGWRLNENYSGPSETGYKCLLTSLPTSGAHEMTIVGYDDSVVCDIDSQVTYGAFIVVNSWGSYYHDRGRYYLPYRFFEEPQDSKYDLSKNVTGIIVQYVEPSLVYSAGIDYSSRDDIRFSVGAAPKAYSEAPETTWQIDIASNQGGDYPMQGRYGPSDIEFAFDASRIADEAFGMEDVTFFLGIRKDTRGSVGGEGKLTSFKVYDYRNGEKNPTIWTAQVGPDATIEKGQNWYPLRTVSLKTTSASSVKWLDTAGQPVNASFIVKTPKGGYAKVKFSGYDREKGTIKIKYVYASDSHIGH